MVSLLLTKITIPPISPKQIPRPRLIELVSNGVKRALTLIVAPAGYGKTSLVAAWLQHTGHPAAWLTLQPNDRSKERFLSYIIHSLQKNSPTIGQTTLALLQTGSFEAALIALINDLTEAQRDIILVLDDYHNVEEVEINQIIQYLMENRPSGFHLIITSRVSPALNLIRMKALDQVREIGLAELRFSPSEVRAFLETSMDLYLESGEIDRLDRLTEGWPVGLQLAALAMARKPTGWSTEVGKEHIFEYFAEEVLIRETEEVQRFLKITSLFDRFCVPLCEYLLQKNLAVRVQPDEPNVTQLLEYIKKSNLFLISLDPSDSWYRYHAVFGDFLRQQVPESQAQDYYSMASEWFKNNDFLDDAIHYAMHATDFEKAALMLESHYIDMLQRGEQAAILEWVSGIPDSILTLHPKLWLAKGWSYIILFNSTQAEECAQKAKQLIALSEPDEQLEGEIKTMMILNNIFSGKVNQDIEISSAFVSLSEKDLFLHSLLHFNLGLRNVLMGETTQAVEQFNQTIQLTEQLNNPLVAIVAGVQLGETRQIRGALGLAERTFQKVIHSAKTSLGEHTFLLGMPFVSYSDLLREENRFVEAEEFAEQGINYCQQWQPMASMDGLITLARLRAAQHRWAESDQLLNQAMLIAENSDSVIDDGLIAVHMARLALLENEFTKAKQIIQTYQLEKVEKESYYFLQELIWLVLCRADLFEARNNSSLIEKIQKKLDQLIFEAEQRERLSPLIEALLLKSYTAHMAGRYDDVIHSLSRAFTLGAQSGYCRIFADEGKQLLELLEEYQSQIQAPTTYFDSILTLIRRENMDTTWENADAIPENFMPLTRRELEILSLLALGKSNQDISEEFVLTLNTVKKHVSNILGKLGVSNRTQAVMLAKERGWLD